MDRYVVILGIPLYVLMPLRYRYLRQERFSVRYESSQLGNYVSNVVVGYISYMMHYRSTTS